MTRSEFFGIRSLDDDHPDFAAACILTVKRSKVRQAVVASIVRLGADPGEVDVLAIEGQVSKGLLWSLDASGAPVFAMASGRENDDVIGTYVQAGMAGLLDVQQSREK